ncbi:unnamed protein product [Porites evermanni]|uniref:EF-hand domain-containing protein n=1 Tax=Porites evermanni TaxID=104178 RepID=A0ABN8MD45_9CNID|nr:unnamed protein product [Porites evermanni]
MDSSFKQLFIKLAGVDREIDAFELQQILSTATKKVLRDKEFSLEACRSIIDLKDVSFKHSNYLLFIRTINMKYLPVHVYVPTSRYWLCFQITNEKSFPSIKGRALNLVLIHRPGKLRNGLLNKFVFDDKTGKLDYDEFKEVWQMVKDLLKIFAEHDKDNSGTMDMYEMRSALSKQGINLSDATLNAMASRFNNKKGNLSFDDFLQIVCRIYSLKDNFDRYADRTGTAKFSLDDYLRACVTL